MTGLDDLVDAIAAADADLLRSSVPTARAPATDGPLSLEAALDLGRGRWVCVVVDESGRRWTAPVVRQGGAIRRARAGDGVAEALVERIADAEAVEPPFTVQSYAGRRAGGERAMGVDQANESVVVGEAAVVKWSLRLPPRGNTAAPATRRLTALAAAGFDGMPELWGLLSLRVADASPILVASVAGYLPGAVDGWDWATGDVRAYAAGDVDPSAAAVPPAELGTLTARMHLAFAAAGRDAAAPDDAGRWAADASQDLEAALARIDGPEGDRLAARAPQVAAELAVLAGLGGTPLIEVHGDLHVGQVLRHSRPSMPPAYAITDFDGNPVASIEEHSRLQPAAVDVAGMMASLDHVGRVVLRRSPGIDRARVLTWIDEAQDAFLRSYRQALGAADALDLLDERLVRPLRFRQECREFLYAADHLPHWGYVPDASLAALLTTRR
jgi:maltokinase